MIGQRRETDDQAGRNETIRRLIESVLVGGAEILGVRPQPVFEDLFRLSYSHRKRQGAQSSMEPGPLIKTIGGGSDGDRFLVVGLVLERLSLSSRLDLTEACRKATFGLVLFVTLLARSIPLAFSALVGLAMATSVRLGKLVPERLPQHVRS